MTRQLLYITLILQNEVEARKIDIYDDLLSNNGTQICVQSCPWLPLESQNDQSNSCIDICVASSSYCNGHIDLNATEQEIFIIIPAAASEDLQSNYTYRDALLYPDELYCSSRLHALFMVSYVLSFVSFAFAVALIVRTRPLIHFLLRRRAKEIRKRRLQEENSA